MSLQDWYLHLKSLHIIAVVSWFAGLFYVFRLFVYHVQSRAEPAVCRTLSVMERKLLRIIMLPAAVVTLASGLGLSLVLEGSWGQSWLQLKALGVLGLLVYQWVAWRTHRRFSVADFWLTERQCRLLNEVPTVLLIFIVMLVVFKPLIF